MNLNSLLKMSRRYGGNEEYVLAGGGNTSRKQDGVMYVKGSGSQLSDITEDQFVGMDVQQLHSLAGHIFPEDITDADREADVLSGILAARLPGNETKRPSVEAILHAMFPYKYVLHLHPALVNGLTCSADGEKACSEIFGNAAVWINFAKPGISLAQICKKAFDNYKAATGKHPQLVLLQNHGVFAAADTVSEIDAIMADMWVKLESKITGKPDFAAVPFDRKMACSIAPALRMLYDENGNAVSVFCTNAQVMRFTADAASFKDLVNPYTPDHIVYCNDEPLFISSGAEIAGQFHAYEKQKGYKPKIVAVQGLGFFALGKTKKEAEQARMLFLNTVKIAVYAQSFGGVLPMTREFADFIKGWEAESYRSKVSQSVSGAGRLAGRIALVTGAAQGFGKGIAAFLASSGACVAAADINKDGAETCAAELCGQAGDPYRAVPVRADVTDRSSVEHMVHETVLTYGGLDILISNAGVLTAGGIDDFDTKEFDFVTDVNYKGYFLCVKSASKIMKIQREYSPGYLTDIIEINSKSGLEGSNKNFAYAGSKFGGIGLTQSFALELAEYGIKVNAICPGNYLDGPLWSDPDKGLFRQYLDSGKVPGAKTIADVRSYYESRVPLKRGCTLEDVTRAVLYIIEQRYETGQALPVTGGQVMLN